MLTDPRVRNVYFFYHFIANEVMSWLSFSCITWTKDLSVIHLFPHQIAKKLNERKNRSAFHSVFIEQMKLLWYERNAFWCLCSHYAMNGLYMWLFRFLLRCGWVMKKSWSFLRCNLEIRCDIETCYIFVFASLHSWSTEQSTMWGILMMPTLYLFVFWCVRLNVLVYIFVVFLRLPFSCLCCTYTSTHPKTDAVVVHNGFVIPTFVGKVCYAYVDPISLHGFTTVNNIVLFSLFCFTFFGKQFSTLTHQPLRWEIVFASNYDVDVCCVDMIHSLAIALQKHYAHSLNKPSNW